MHQVPALSGYSVSLRPVAQTDLESLRQWRNSPDVREQMISQTLISKEQQQAWFSKLARDELQMHWVIEYKGVAIGSANIRALYASSVFTAQTIEPGLYIGDERYRQNLLAFAPTLVLNDYCFYQLGVQQLRAVVKQTNHAALNYNQKLGYKIHKQAELCELVLTLTDYEAKSVMLKQLLSRTRSTSNDK